MTNGIYQSLEKRALDIGANLPDPKTDSQEGFDNHVVQIIKLRQDYIRNYQDLSDSNQERFNRLLSNVQMLARDILDVYRVRSMKSIAKKPPER